jgi:hypothetical protein
MDEVQWGQGISPDSGTAFYWISKTAIRQSQLHTVEASAFLVGWRGFFEYHRKLAEDSIELLKTQKRQSQPHTFDAAAAI